MTRKHFRAIALGLANQRPPVWTQDDPHPLVKAQWKRWEQIVEEMICVCSEFNPRFDSETFLRWCLTK